MKEEDVKILGKDGGFVVRIFIGGSMYFDSPVTSAESCETIKKNLLQFTDRPIEKWDIRP